MHLFLFPMKDWYLRGQFKDGVQTGGGRITYVKLFTTIALIILLIAGINFMNRYTQYFGNCLAHEYWYNLLRLGKVYFSDDDYQLYLDLLRKHCTEAEVSIWAWVLMPNMPMAWSACGRLLMVSNYLPVRVIWIG